MSLAHIHNASRRDFLKAGAGLTLGICLSPALAASADEGTAAGTAFAPNAFVRIGTDSRVTVIAKHLEMGQGAYTGLATLVAEELDAAWSQVRVESAPADKRYANLFLGMQGVGGSTGLANSFEQFRKAGASARHMLVAAAARQWQVKPEEITVSDGIVKHASGRQASFGDLAEAAAREDVPADIRLKDPKQFKLIGKRAPRKDSREKSTGKAVFTQDVKLPGLLTAVVAHPPRFGAKLVRFDAAKAKAIPGVVDVVQIPSGVAVLAKDFWTARKGREALVPEWDESAAIRISSAAMFRQYRELADKPGTPAARRGDGSAMSQAARRIDAVYEFPYLAHATMEPMNCVVRLGPDTCEIWNGDQMQTFDQMTAAATVGMKPEQVSINTLYAGGSFGRRGNTSGDYVLEAVQIAKAIGGRAPVKLVWSREDDLRAGAYRPAYLHKLGVGLDAAGKPLAWEQHIVGQSVADGTAFASFLIKDGVDRSSVEGAVNLPYAVPNLSIDLHTTQSQVPVTFWRSVGSTHNAYAAETMLDEMAHAADGDPVAYRRALLQDKPRHLGVLDLAAVKAGWGKPLAAGKSGERRGRGIAVHESFGSFVAQVAEVTVRQDGSFSVDRVVCAVDCGIAVNPDNVRAQMEGGIIFGLSAALAGKVTLKDGAVEQSNFDDYPVLRINQAPRIDVHIVTSSAPPSGVGEPGVPPIAPAVANALFAATGKRMRQLPFDTELLKA